MPEKERRERLTIMQEHVQKWDINHWASHVTDRFEALDKRRVAKAASSRKAETERISA